MGFFQIFSILFVLLGRTSSIAFAQGTGSIQGSLIEANTSEPVDYASVVLMKQSDNSYVSEAQTDTKGNFVFQHMADGLFLVKITFVGYQNTERQNIAVKKGEQLTLGRSYCSLTIQGY